MEKLKNNKLFKIYQSIENFIISLITNSFIFGVLTKEVKRKKEDSFFENILYKIIDFLRGIFNKLKLDKIFDGSIFAKTEHFIGLTIFLAPILPTMLDLLLVCGTLLSFFLKVMLDKDFKFTYTPVNLFLNIFVVIYLISSFISNSPSTSIKIALLIIAFMLFYYVIINTIKTEKQLNVMLAIFVIVGLFISLYGIYQFMFGGSFASSSFVDKTLFEDINTRVNGTFDNPNVMGEYLLFVIPLLATYFFRFKTFRTKLLALISTGIACVALALTYSRGCYLGLIVSIALFLLLVSIKFVFLFIAGIIAFPFVAPKSIMNRITSIGNTEDNSTSYRISIWKGTLALIEANWFKPVGQGADAFNSIYPYYALNGVSAEHTHNLFLQIAVETSLFGFGVFVLMLFRIFQALFSSIKNCINKDLKYPLIGFVSAMSGFLLQSLFDNTWYNNRIVLVFWIFVGLSMATRNLAFNEKSQK